LIASGSDATILTGTSISSNSTVQSNISGITIPTTTASQLDTRQRGTHFANVNPDNALMQLIPSVIKIRDLMAADRPPTLDNGEQVCLSYLLRGGCWSTCKCMATHGHQPAPAEHTKLTAYLRTQKQKLNTGGQHAPVSP
jgi:hypothetical protein